jgi:hypothetical protein
MRRIGWMFLVVLGAAGLMQAQSSSNAMESSKSMELSGTVCQSTCVSKVANLSTCDTLCTDKSGSAVLVDDQGNVRKIANQDMCKSHMGKHVKMTAVPSEKEREDSLRIMELHETPGGG